MAFWEAVRLALQTIRAQKLKSAFSIIGVFIGVMFLIAVVSVVQGMNRYMTDKFAGTLLGVNTFRLRQFPDVQLGNVTDSTWRVWRRRPRVSYEDAQAVMRGVTVPVLAAWESSTRTTLVAGHRHAKDVEVTAATELYFDIRALPVEQGRPFTGQEVQAGVPGLGLGHELADKLFEGQDPIGREVRIFGLPYRVIGVVEKQGNLFGLSLDKFAVAPASAPLKSYVSEPRVVDAVAMKARSQPEMRAAMAQAEAIMRSRRHLRPREPNDFALETADEVLDFWSKISRVLFVALPGLVAISLVVGGIVIMNIMLMAVAERTREIGIRKSLGARRRDILRQFLAEATALATVGAALGIVTGVGLSVLLQAVSPLPASVSPFSIVLGVVVGGGVGRVVSGGVVISDGSDEMSPWRHNPPISVADAQVIARLPRVSWVALDEGGQADVTFGAKTQHSVRIFGRSAAWPNVAGGDVSPGRSFTEVEDAAAAQVAVVNQKLAELLFDRIDPIGQRIHIQGVPYTVIGVFNPPPQLFGGQPSPEAIIPHGALIKYVRYWKGWMDLLVGPAPAATTAEAMEDATEALRLRRHLRPGQDNNFAVVSQEKFLEKLNSMTLIIRFVLFILSAVGLIVGGVGVIAIMMISVTERTREIGVRKALGATRREILWQFLVEAATLTLVGGVVGMIGGGLAAVVLALATPIPAHVPRASVVA